MDTELAILKERVATLTSIVEGLLARYPQALPPPLQLAVVNSSGQVLDWNGSAYVAESTSGSISYSPPGGTQLVWRPQAQRWETIGAGIAIATLDADLDAGSSADATYDINGSGDVTVWDAPLCEGDKLTSGTKVVIANLGGKWYAIQAVCPC